MDGQGAFLFSVIIVNYNSGERLGHCLEKLAAQSESRFEIIVADNASMDQSIAAAQATGVAFRLLRLEKNMGFAAANNCAAEKATADWLLFLNPDAYALPDWIEEIHAGVKKYPDTDAFGSTQLMADNPSRLDGAGDAYHAAGVPYRGHHGWALDDLPPEGECFAPCAAAAAYRRERFMALGGFEESFFCYGEDVDLGFRLRLAGGRCVQLPAARVAHEGSAITGRRSDFSIYHGHRNRLWTYWRNMPLVLLIALFPLHMAANIVLLMIFIMKGEARPYLKAMAHGAAGIGPVMAARKKIQHQRKISTLTLARALTWSPFKLWRRAADIRPAALSVSP